MNKLEKIVEQILSEIKSQHTAATFASRQSTLQHLLRFAESRKFTEPCQELYDAFTADDKGSKDIWFHKSHAVRLVDKEAGTTAKDKFGKLYNQPPLPSVSETVKFLKKASFPEISNTDIGYLIVLSEQQLRVYGLTASTIGQYRHAWLEIRQYCFEKENDMVYRKGLILQYVDEMSISRDKGELKEWKWKIRRKAASVLMEVAETGVFQWKPISPHPSCGDEELDKIRDRYVETLQKRNLASTYILLCEYVFRYALKHGEISSYQELSSLDSKGVVRITEGFSKTCNNRSMATILPVLRSILHYLGTAERISMPKHYPQTTPISINESGKSPLQKSAKRSLRIFSRFITRNIR